MAKVGVAKAAAKDGGNGKGTGGKGYGWGKGKGNGSGKGDYGLDLMGNADWGGGDSWGGDAQWPGDQWNNQGEWETIPLRSCDARYGRALAMLGPAPIATHNAFASIADTSDSYGVPITDLVINRRKPQNQTRTIATATKCGCRDHQL